MHRRQFLPTISKGFIAAALFTLLTAGTATMALTACGSGESDYNPSKPDNPNPPVNTSNPTVTVLVSEANVFGGVKVEQADSSLMIGGEKVAEWKAGSGRVRSVALTLNGTAVSPGSTLSESGDLVVTVTNDGGKTGSGTIHLTDEVIAGLSFLEYMQVLQVDVEVDLLVNLTVAKGFELAKTELEFDGQRTEIDPAHFTPQYPGPCSLSFFVKKGSTVSEVKVENLTIIPMEYGAVEVANIKPVDILPIIGQIEAGEKNAYDHIEHLRVAEATRIRDMMWKYGAGNHSAEEYQQLMMRLYTGMTMESPKGYDNYEIIGGNVTESGISNHAHDEWNILNNLVDHTNFCVVDPKNENWHEVLYEFVKNNPNIIFILGNSSAAEVDKQTYESWGNDDIKNLSKSKNFLIFVAGGNIGTKGGILRNKIYHEDVNGDEHGLYSLPSSANGKNDTNADRHMIVSIGTDADGDIDQTNEIYESSKYPVGFNNNILFAGRTFPRYSLTLGKTVAENGKYPTSYVNYTNVAIADLCFQMKADVANVDKLLEMIRSTALTTDHIRFDLNGDGDTNDTYQGQSETQPLILMNPAGFFKTYLMPTDLPTTVSWSNAVVLNKGYYHGIVFDIPGAEVLINGQWIAFSDKNASLIKAQNPMNLQWRLSGDLLRKLGYKQGDTVTGHMLAVDDQWNGLTITKDFTTKVE